MPFKTSADTSATWGWAADTVSYSRVELGKNGSRPSLGFAGMTKADRDTTSGAAGWATGAAGTQPLDYQWRFNGTNLAAATGSTITNPAESHAATALLLKLTHQFI